MNLKKLLELYLELLAINNTRANDPTLLAKLSAWAKNSGLQKITTGILKKKQ